MSNVTTDPSARAISEIFNCAHFEVDITGVATANFIEVSGLSAEVEPIAYREGGSRQIVHQLPGMVRYPPVECRFGITLDDAVWQWVNQSLEGSPVRRSVGITHLSPGGSRLKTYVLDEAWPTRWEAAPLNSMENAIAIAGITLVHERLRVE